MEDRVVNLKPQWGQVWNVYAILWFQGLESESRKIGDSLYVCVSVSYTGIHTTKRHSAKVKSTFLRARGENISLYARILASLLLL